MIKQQKKATKEEENVHCLQNHFFHIFFWAYGSRFFSFIFPVSWILSGKINCQIFFCDFHVDILLIVLMIAKKKYLTFFLGGTGHEPKIDGSFDFGVLVLGVWILEFWFWILDPSILGLYLSSQGPWEVVEGMYQLHVLYYLRLYKRNLILPKFSVTLSFTVTKQRTPGAPFCCFTFICIYIFSVLLLQNTMADWHASIDFLIYPRAFCILVQYYFISINFNIINWILQYCHICVSISGLVVASYELQCLFTTDCLQ